MQRKKQFEGEFGFHKGNNITSLYSPSIGGLLRRILVDNGISTDLRDIGKKQCDGAFSFLYEVAT